MLTLSYDLARPELGLFFVEDDYGPDYTRTDLVLKGRSEWWVSQYSIDDELEFLALRAALFDPFTVLLLKLFMAALLQYFKYELGKIQNPNWWQKILIRIFVNQFLKKSYVKPVLAKLDPKISPADLMCSVVFNHFHTDGFKALGRICENLDNQA